MILPKKNPCIGYVVSITDQSLEVLFSNPRDSELMRWWALDERKKDDGVLHHPSEAQQWKDFSAKYQEFHEDRKNVRFTLRTDGMNPFGDKTSTHIT